MRLSLFSRVKRIRLAVTTASVVLAHAAVAILLCLTTGHDRPRQVEPGGGGYLLVSLASPASSAPQSRISGKAKPAEPPAMPEPDASAAAPDEDEASAPQLSSTDAQVLSTFQPDLSAAGDGPGCNLSQALNALLTASPEVRRSLDEMPPAQRSVANAVMLWDGQWSQDSVSGGKALLRALLIKAVAGARPECLSNVNHGPVLFYVPDANATVVIAVGSGDWRWGDLIMPGTIIS